MLVARHLMAFLALGLTIVPRDAIACEYAVPFFNFDKPVKQSADCSFEYAGVGAIHGFVEGGAQAIDIGDGVIAQKLTGTLWCFAHETLLVADCKKRESAMFVGVEHPEASTARIVRLLQPPHGKLALTPGVSIGSLVGIAEAEGYEYHLDVQDRLKKMKPRNRFDQYCGCKVYYPDSSGAEG